MNQIIGKHISHYEILAPLGKGAMGQVYQAEDTQLHRRVALKFLPGNLLEDPTAKKRFLTEARAASALDHPNICNIHEIDETPDGQVFICMASYEGETLQQKLRRGPMPLSEVMAIAKQIVCGLAKAHQVGIIHRDIKPANIFITVDGVVKILDFGLAKFSNATTVTKTGTPLGTPAYMSPEQILGEPVDHRSDIWSLGVVLYEMLTGENPFLHEYEQTTIYAILNREPKSICASHEEINASIEATIFKCLRKEREERYSSIDEFCQEFEASLSGKNECVLEPVSRPTLSARRLRLMGGILLAVMVVAVVLVVIKPDVREGIFRQFGLPVQNIKHLVVLPITPIGEDEQARAWCDGLMTALVSKLTQMKGYREFLRVIPASEVLQKNISSADGARKQFGAQLALSGTLRRDGSLLQLILNLVDASTLRQIDSKEVIVPEPNSLLIQEKALEASATMLQSLLKVPKKSKTAENETEVPDAHDYYLIGLGYLNRYSEFQKNIDLAIRLFTNSVQADSQYALAYAGLGKAYWRKYETTRDTQWVHYAIRNCSYAAELNHNLAPVRVTLGLIYKGTGQTEKAVRELTIALEIDPANMEAYGRLAEIYGEQGKNTEAENLYRKAIQTDRTYWKGYNDLGGYYYRQGQYKQALEQFKHVTGLTPDNTIGYNNSAAVYFHLHDWDQAIESYKEIIRLEPTRHTAFINTATCYFYKGDYSVAAQYARKAIELQGTNYLYYGFLADALYRIPGQKVQARKYYLRAIELLRTNLEINPGDMVLLADLAAYCSMIDDRKQARTILKELERRAITDPEMIIRMADTYEQLDERGPALRWVGQALAFGYQEWEVRANPSFKGLVEDARYRELLRP